MRGSWRWGAGGLALGLSMMLATASFGAYDVFVQKRDWAQKDSAFKNGYVEGVSDVLTAIAAMPHYGLSPYTAADIDAMSKCTDKLNSNLAIRKLADAHLATQSANIGVANVLINALLKCK